MRVSWSRIGSVIGTLVLIGFSAWSLHFFARYQPLAGLMASSPLDQIGLQVHHAEVTGRVAGRRRWRVKADLITFSRDQRQVAIAGLQQGRLYNAQGRPLVALSAGSIVYQSPNPVFTGTTQGFLQVNSGVQARLIQVNGPQINATGLTWNPVQNLVQSQGAVTVRFPAQHGTALGGAQMVADGVQWDSNKDILQSQGHVRVAFAGGVGTADGQGVSVDLHTDDLTMNTLTGTFNLVHVVQTTMASRSTRPLVALAGVALLATPLAAAPQQPVNYASGHTLWLNNQHQAQMSQSVTLQQGDDIMQTQTAVVNFDDQQQALNAVSHAPVHLWDTQSDLTGQHGTIDFTTHIATITDNVVLTVKPGPENSNASAGSLKSRFKDPATLTCSLMTYDYRRKFGTVPGPLTIHQKDRVLTADSGTYDGRLQIVTLIGHVHGQNGEGEIDAPKAIIGVRQNEEFILSPQPTHGVLTPKNDDSGDDTQDNEPVNDTKGYDTILNNGQLPPDTTPTAPDAPGGGQTGPSSPPSSNGPASPIAPAPPTPTVPPAPGTPSGTAPAKSP
jgi:lipopolysaccharide export system protein LptA